MGELSLGNHTLQGVRLPAIDLSAIAKACGGTVDGILGVDLLEQLGIAAPRLSLEFTSFATRSRGFEPPLVHQALKDVTYFSELQELPKASEFGLTRQLEAKTDFLLAHRTESPAKSTNL